MKPTEFQLRVLRCIEQNGWPPSDTHYSSARRASLNKMHRAKWIEKHATKGVLGYSYRWKLTPMGESMLHQTKLAI